MDLQRDRPSRQIGRWPHRVAWAFLLAVLAWPTAALAATRTWGGGGGDNNWSTSGNWDTLPVDGDSVVFNGTSTKNCTIDVDLVLGNFSINSGYTGTISPSGTRTLQLGQDRSGGTFTFAGAGTFTAPAIMVIKQFTKSAGTFNHNSGTVYLSSTTNQGTRDLTDTFQSTVFNKVVILDGLAMLGRWKMDDTGTLTGAVDSGPYGLDMGVSATAPTASTSHATTSFTNTGSAVLATTPAYFTRSTLDALLRPSNWTLSAWVKVTSLGVNGSDIISGGNAYMLRIMPSGGNKKVQAIMKYDATHWYTCDSTTTFNDSNWHHLVADNQAGDLSVWLDGTKTNTGTNCGVTGGTQSYASVTNSFEIGRNPTGASYYFSGNVDDVRVYGRSLTDTEIQALYGSGTGGEMATALSTYTVGDRFYTGTLRLLSGTLDGSSQKFHAGIWTNSGGTFTGSTSTVVLDGSANQTLTESSSFYALRIEDPRESNLVGYWKLDDGQGTTVRDWAGSNNGTMSTTGVSWTTSTMPTTAFDNAAAATFTLTNQGIAFPVTYTQAVTLSAWVYMTGDGEGNHPRFIYTPFLNVNITTNASDTIRADPSWSTTPSWEAGSITRNAWNHIAVTYNGTSDTDKPTIYVNGINQGTPTLKSGSSTGSTTRSGTGTGTGYIGCRSTDGVTFNRQFVGTIDDVRIYNTVLSQAQIMALASGTYAGGGGASTTTLGANLTLTNSIKIDSGILDTSSYNLDAQGTAATSYFNGGSFIQGSGTTSFYGDVVVRDLVAFKMSTAGGVVRVGGTHNFTMDGDLEALPSGASATIKAISGNFNFNIGSYYNNSTDKASPTLNITGLNVQNTGVNGMYINSYGASPGPTTTITRFDNVNFSSGSSTSGACLLNIYDSSLYLTGNNCTFDRTSMNATSYNVKVAGNGTSDGETRATFGNSTCKNTAGVTEVCESNDSDDDGGNDGVADTAASNGGIVQFVKQAYSESTGTIAGFPTPSFNWTSFAYWRTYSAFNNDDGAGNNKVYARDDSNSSSTAYTYSIDTATYGTIVGSPRWDMESTTHYVYFVTSKGYVYKLTDDGSSLSLASGYPYHNVTGGANATASSPLVMDSSSLYWAGKDGGGSRKMFRVTRSSGALNGTPRAISADINGGLALATVSSTSYLFGASDLIASNGKVYKLATDLGTEFGSSNGQQSTTNISGRLSIYGGAIYFAEDKGKVWAIDTTDNLATIWSYQDTGNGHGACSASSDCTVKALYLEPRLGRIYYGDQDGHVYVVSRSGMTANGTLYNGFPMRPTGGGTNDPFTTAPVYMNGLGGANAGVIAIGSSTGKVFFIDQQNAAMTPAPALIRMYHYGSAVSAITYRITNSSSGTFMISTANGHTYYVDSADVNDPTPNNN